MKDILINLVFEPWFWFGVFIFGGAGLMMISYLDRRDWNNYLPKDKDLDDGV